MKSDASVQEQSKKAGAALGDFIGTLLNKTGEKYMAFHLVGTDVAAEDLNVASRRISETSGRRVNRITLLDPHVDVGTFRRPEADFVDVVHVSDGGRGQPLGDVDFYVLEGDTTGMSFRA